MLANANTQSAQLRPLKCRGLPSARRTQAEWAFRILFVLCCAMVVFMVVHGDDHGRRPRFVWRSFEDTIKVEKLQTSGDRTDDSVDVAPPVFAIAADMPDLAPHASSVRDQAFSGRGFARRPAYILPFGNGPPRLT